MTPQEARMDEMAAAYQRDHEGQGRMREMRRLLLEYLSDAPPRTSQQTRAALVRATSELQEDMRRVDRVWD